MRSHAHADRSGGDTASEPTLTCCATLLAVYFILATSMFGVGMPAGRRLRVRVRASVGMPAGTDHSRPLPSPLMPYHCLLTAIDSYCFPLSTSPSPRPPPPLPPATTSTPPRR